MLKFINLKKLTAKTLVSILVAGSFTSFVGTKRSLAKQCDNNGHGNNGDITLTYLGKEIWLTKFDPSNPGEGDKITREIEDSNPGLLKPVEVAAVVAMVRTGNFDFEWKPANGHDRDCDGINDEIEVNNNFANPVDTDGDGTPDFLDTDSDGDGIADSLEGSGDSDNDGVPDYLDTDSDGDGIADSLEGSGDSDNDGVPDYLDTDSDNDGTADSLEGTGDSDGDGVPDYLDAIYDSSATSTSTDANTSSSPEKITLTGIIRDFKDTHPDFESTTGTDKNIVTTQLGADRKPVYKHGEKGTKTTNGQANFDQWYRNVPGVNLAKKHSIELELQPDGSYKYQNNQFFPIDGELFGNYKDGKNYHFTYELHTKFTYKGGETFAFSGDDDVWVYIDGERVIDIGGVHTSQSQEVALDSLSLTPGQTYDLDFFFAERHYSQSNFTITTNIELVSVPPQPNGDDDGDGISNRLEGFDTEVDTDGDGIEDYLDNDSDNNGVTDSNEVGVASSPTDSDSDGTPNFQDDDDDGNGILDVDEIGDDPLNPTNTDGADLPDYQDTDDDNDGIIDIDELGDSSSPTDTDGDNTPDYHDLDSDGDGISDKDETDDDFDGDGTPNFRDDDSDGDTIPDSVETGEDSSLDDDSDPNFLDLDSDGDGIPDKNEEMADSNKDDDDETDVTSKNLGDGGTVENVDGEKDGDNYLDLDSDGDGFEDDIDPSPYIYTYAD